LADTPDSSKAATKKPRRAAATSAEPRKLYVLDTNVLMHDPTCLFRFAEHDIFLPMTVLEELDHAKKGASEVSRNVRSVSRFIDELFVDSKDLSNGVAIRPPSALGIRGPIAEGRLFFETTQTTVPAGLSHVADNKILNCLLAQSQLNPERPVVLVSKDINLRIKATILGLRSEDYHNDRALDDLSLLYSGSRELDADFWQRHKELRSWSDKGRTFYEFKVPSQEVHLWFPCQLVYLGAEGDFEAIVRAVKDDVVTLQIVDDYRSNYRSVWGVCARNREQNFALNLLMDPEIDFVTLLGTAGTGKTLLTLAAGLALTMDQHRFREIIVTRATVPVGEDIGFLPGTEEEKMTPWMGALADNLEVLSQPQEGGSWGRQATQDLLASRIKIRSLNFMRGRTFLSRWLIIDEAQNLTSKQMKTLITRAGPGTKVICMGNIEQIDTPYLTEMTSGLTYVVDRFKRWQHGGHITLRRGERSRLADYASEVL
jgi:PhoH-like ATPase